MLQRVTMDGIEMPRLYIAENQRDADLAMSKGIPFIRWTQGQDLLIKILLRPVLERMFPHIKWSKVLGPKRRFRTKVSICEQVTEEEPEQEELGIRLDKVEHDDSDAEPFELPDEDGFDEPDYNMLDVDLDDDGETLIETSGIASSERLFDGGGQDMVVVHNLDLQDYIGDLSSSVNLEVLQRLRLMPAFIGDILDCIKINVGSGMRWREGYNKRLGLTVGRYNSSQQLPNLIILDVSGSIPRGISATMISLIDTLRTQLSADLIITSSNSRFYHMGSSLPDPQRIRDMFGYGNESREFFGILEREIRGRHYGHVFSFGDNDTPSYHSSWNPCPCMAGTVVEHVHHYHTGESWWQPEELRGSKEFTTGYAKWCHMLSKPPLEEYDTSWCEVIKD